MNERGKASQFRSELKAFYGPRVHVQPLIDARRTISKPYDCYVVTSGKFYAIEFKDVKGKTINGSILQNNQINGLLEVENLGREALVICFFAHKEFKGKLFVCGISEWLEIFDMTQKNGVWSGSSVKVEELMVVKFLPKRFHERCKCKLPDGTSKTMWNFAEIL